MNTNDEANRYREMLNAAKDQLHELDIPRIHDPLDRGVRMSALERRDGRNGMHDVTERSQPNDQESRSFLTHGG